MAGANSGTPVASAGERGARADPGAPRRARRVRLQHPASSCSPCSANDIMFATRHLTRLGRPLAMSASRRPFHATAARLGLLKGMNPILTADLLHVLRSAGHGDEITLVDCNFPAASTATKTVTGAPIILAGVDLPTAVDAICSIMPLDFFVDCPALCAVSPSVPHRTMRPGGSVPSHCAKGATCKRTS